MQNGGLSQRARWAFTTHGAESQPGSYSGHENVHDDTSEEGSTDSEEGIATGQYTNRYYALKRRKKRDIAADLIKVIADNVCEDDRARHIACKYTPAIMGGFSIFLSFIGFCFEGMSVTGCELSYTILALIMTSHQSYYLIELLRDGAVRPHAHGHLPPEIHFLAGNLPGTLAYARLAAVGGFVLGLLGVLFAVFLMDTDADTKFYMFLCTLFLVTSMLALWIQWRDAFDSEIWEDEVMFPHGSRSLRSSRVEHALKNIHNTQTHTSIVLKGIYFFSMVFCLIVIVFMLIWYSTETHHTGVMFGLTLFNVGLGWFFGKWANRSIADSYADSSASSADNVILPAFLFSIVASVICVFGFLDFDENPMHRKLTLAVALITVLDSCLNLSKVAHKQANVKLLLDTLEQRMGTPLSFGNPADVYGNLMHNLKGGDQDPLMNQGGHAYQGVGYTPEGGHDLYDNQGVGYIPGSGQLGGGDHDYRENSRGFYLDDGAHTEYDGY